MELPKDDIPKSIFLDLSFEYLSFRLAHSHPVTIASDEIMSEPFPDPVADIVAEHRAGYSTYDCQYEVISSPESSYEDHHVHPWYSCPDERK